MIDQPIENNEYHEALDALIKEKRVLDARERVLPNRDYSAEWATLALKFREIGALANAKGCEVRAGIRRVGPQLPSDEFPWQEYA